MTYFNMEERINIKIEELMKCDDSAHYEILECSVNDQSSTEHYIIDNTTTITRPSISQTPKFRTQTKIYICNVCSATFQRSYQLQRHNFIGDHRTRNGHTIKVNSITDKPIPHYPTLHNGVKSKLKTNNVVGILEDPLALPEIKVAGANGTTLHFAPKVVIKQETTSWDNNEYLGKYDLIIPVKKEINEGEDERKGSSLVISSETEHQYNQILYDLKRHGNGNIKKICYKCAVCRCSFDELHIIDEHMQQHNGTPYKFKCELCDEFFSHVDYLRNHVIGHTDTNLYKCENCEKTFRHVCTLMDHMMVKSCWYLGPIQIFKCMKCRKTYLNEDLYTSHMYQHDGFGVKPYKCELCDESFIHSAALSKHRDFEKQKIRIAC